MSTTTNIEIKNVIVPFDFSNSAQNALQHAIGLAKKFRADLILVSTMDSFSSQCLQYRGNKFVDFAALSQEKMKEFTKQIFIFNKVDSLVIDAKWSRAINDMNDKFPGSLVVLGVGGKGRDGYFEASHAYRIVDQMNIPLFVVKEDQKARDIKIISTPLDETFHTREKLPFVTLMASAFDAKVSLVGIQTHTDKDSAAHMQAIMRQASQYIQEKVKQYQDKLVASKNEVNEVVKHTSDENADLLVIMSSHEKSLSNLFSGPYAQQVTDKSTAPILICPIRISLVMGAVSI